MRPIKRTGKVPAALPGLVLFILFVLNLCGVCSPAASAAADDAINVKNDLYWRDVLQQYRADDAVNQLLLVRYTGGCHAIVRYYVKQTDENNAWSQVFEADNAVVGINGIGKQSEGDGKTPTGDFGVVTAFGIRKNPGTALPYHDITPETYACDEAGAYYNTILDTKETGHACHGEEMYACSPEYNFGLFLDYNAERVPGAGSAIFLHCKGEKGFTGGCVAIPEADMRTVLMTADAGLRVVIGDN